MDGLGYGCDGGCLSMAAMENHPKQPSAKVVYSTLTDLAALTIQNAGVSGHHTPKYLFRGLYIQFEL